MSYLRYFCLFVYSGFQHILCCVFVLFCFVLFCFSLSCVPYICIYCQFPWIVHFWLPLRYSITFILSGTSCGTNIKKSPDSECFNFQQKLLASTVVYFIPCYFQFSSITPFLWISNRNHNFSLLSIAKLHVHVYGCTHRI